MASQMKCGSCGFKSDDSSRRIRAWGGGAFSGWNILKYPARLICVYFKKLYLRKNVLKLNIRALSLIIVEG